MFYDSDVFCFVVSEVLFSTLSQICAVSERTFFRWYEQLEWFEVNADKLTLLTGQNQT